VSTPPKYMTPIKTHFLCPSPYKPGDIITVYRMIYPSWWQFWRKPYRIEELHEVVSA
jgi:hypothetical protein